MSDVPNWDSQFGLVHTGSYYEGCVDDLSLVLEIYQCDTIELIQGVCPCRLC